SVGLLLQARVPLVAEQARARRPAAEPAVVAPRAVAAGLAVPAAHALRARARVGSFRAGALRPRGRDRLAAAPVRVLAAALHGVDVRAVLAVELLAGRDGVIERHVALEVLRSAGLCGGGPGERPAHRAVEPAITLAIGAHRVT